MSHIDILKHFDIETKDYILFSLKEAERDEFISKLIPQYKSSYIRDEDLQARISTFSSTKEQEFSEILPTEGHIKAGDFGEILSYFLFKERHQDKGVDGPRKWRWKQDKNVAAPYSDVILFSIKKKGKVSKNDLLISVESKVKATKGKDYHPIQAAVEGAEKDYVTRIATSLSWLRKKYKEESLKEGAEKDKLIELVNIINRFIKSESVGKYSKKIKAIAIIDKNLFEAELKKPVTIPKKKGMDLTVFAVSIKDLKSAYEKVFEEIPKL